MGGAVEERREVERAVSPAEEELASRLGRERGRASREREPARAESEKSAAPERGAEEVEARGEEALARESDTEESAVAERRGDGALERRDGAEPDVLLHVPNLEVDEISVEVDELHARVALHAEVANLVRLDVGADVDVGRVKIEIQGVRAAALLKVRLDEVYRILERTLTTIDNNPQLLEALLEPVGEAVGEVGKGVGEAVPELGRGVSKTLPEVGKGVGETLPEVGKGVREAVPEIGKGVGEVGKGVGQAAPELGKGVGEVGKGVGQAAPEVAKGVGEVGKGVGQAAPEAGKAVGEAGKGVSQAAPEATKEAGEAGKGAASEVGEGARKVGKGTGEAGRAATGVAGAESRVMESQTGGNRMAEERMNRPEESTGESSSPITFDKLKEDLVQVVQDLTVLLKESVGEPGGKGLLGQLSRLRDTLQEWRQEVEGKMAERKEKRGAKEGGKEAEAKGEEDAEAEEGGKEAEAKGEEGAEAEKGEEKAEAGAKEEGPVSLFDGTEESLENWKSVGWGQMRYEGGELCVESGNDLGLVYFEGEKFDDGVLRLKFLPKTEDFDASVAVRFRDPSQPVPDRDNPETKYNYDNPAYVASHTGFAIHLANHPPAAVPGTFEGILFGEGDGAQLHEESAESRTDDWNELEVEIEGNCYAVTLNGKSTSRFVNVDSYRGKSTEDDSDSGFVGLLHRKGRIHLKDVEFVPREARAEEAPEQEEAPEEAGEEAHEGKS